MLNELLFQFNPWWEVEFSPKLIHRPGYTSKLLESINRKDIEMITGLRRVGKTALMKLVIAKLLKQCEANQIFYISLDAYGMEAYEKKKIVVDSVDAFLKLREIL